MSTKVNDSNPMENLDYEEILEEEIIDSYKNKFGVDSDINERKNRLYWLKRTPIEIVNRLFFLLFIGSFIFSFFLAYSENKIWFVLYLVSAFSCIFYTPNRKAVKELVAAWPNIEDVIKGRSFWSKGK